MSWPIVLVLFGLSVALVIWLRMKQPPPMDDEGRDEAHGELADPDAPRVIAIEDAIDLHGFQPRDVVDVVDSYLEAAADEGLREVRLIHGRGKGVQRRRVQELLANHPLVESFHDAPAHRGGWGATIARLKAGEQEPRP